jgi:hypothetical protein
MNEQEKEEFWEDIGRPEGPIKVHAAYVVVLNEDGSLSTTFMKPGTPLFFEVERATTTYDVFSTSKEIATEIESQLMADRIAKTVISQIMPKDPEAEAKARIAQALAERKAE